MDRCKSYEGGRSEACGSCEVHLVNPEVCVVCGTQRNCRKNVELVGTSNYTIAINDVSNNSLAVGGIIESRQDVRTCTCITSCDCSSTNDAIKCGISSCASPSRSSIGELDKVHRICKDDCLATGNASADCSACGGNRCTSNVIKCTTGASKGYAESCIEDIGSCSRGANYEIGDLCVACRRSKSSSVTSNAGTCKTEVERIKTRPTCQQVGSTAAVDSVRSCTATDHIRICRTTKAVIKSRTSDIGCKLSYGCLGGSACIHEKNTTTGHPSGREDRECVVSTEHNLLGAKDVEVSTTTNRRCESDCTRYARKTSACVSDVESFNANCIKCSTKDVGSSPRSGQVVNIIGGSASHRYSQCTPAGDGKGTKIKCTNARKSVDGRGAAASSLGCTKRKCSCAAVISGRVSGSAGGVIPNAEILDVGNVSLIGSSLSLSKAQRKGVYTTSTINGICCGVSGYQVNDVIAGTTSEGKICNTRNGVVHCTRCSGCVDSCNCGCGRACSQSQRRRTTDVQCGVGSCVCASVDLARGVCGKTRRNQIDSFISTNSIRHSPEVNVATSNPIKGQYDRI